MPKRPTEKITIRLFEGDRERLTKLYPENGYNQVIRSLVHQHCRVKEEELQRAAQKLDLTK